ncbi:MAG: UDP-3-O-(3-hydroxymyristoyl)glucosamine N-acyltransferase, partial [SAR324 cluster bacterium]|nr:UDP-3-O-(3-hydroxymyristoyl)glucosamine N-acyltransferase [SAR324 cluster bacterium]
GTVLGDAETVITGLCSLDESDSSALSFLREASLLKLKKVLSKPTAGALLVDCKLRSDINESPIPLVFVSDPLSALVSVLPYLCTTATHPTGISPKADIHPSAIIDENVSIGSFSVIGPNVHIEKDVVIHPHVTLYEGVHIGAGSIIHSGAVIREYVNIGAQNIIQNGAVIGAEGFGYIPDSNTSSGLVPVPQVGTVNTGAKVDVGANACIDRATLGSTRIGLGTKIDNLVQIGHNVSLGCHNILCGQVGIAGSSTTGDNVVMGGNAGVADHVNIASGVRLGAKCGVIKDIREKGDFLGFPALESKAWHRWYAFMMRSSREGKSGSD